ncbi:MAG TPA: protein tyrosine phosphatase [Rhabdaerophilum sp.]|nr:protein tyrosine phosphatase [Rhabdaerophilum sp.]
MPRIHVCSLRTLHPTVASTGARQVLTLIKNTGQVERPASVTADRHLALDFSDIVAAREGEVLASSTQVEALVDFVRRWDRKAPLVVHCYAGVSRSTAGAFISACALRPDRAEEEWATELRLASPTATPNLPLVTLADRLLDRRGRMIAAIEKIGRGVDCFEGTPFHLDIGPRPGGR